MVRVTFSRVIPLPNSLGLIPLAPAQGNALALRMGEPLFSPQALVLGRWMLLSSLFTLQGAVTPCLLPTLEAEKGLSRAGKGGPPTELKAWICLVPECPPAGERWGAAQLAPRPIAWSTIFCVC